MIGDGRHGASRGPEALVRELRARGDAPFAVERIERGEPEAEDPPAASLAVNRALAPVVRRALTAGRLPLVLAGSCDASMGVLAGADHADWGVVWLDAHGDFNTPESTLTGFFAGMSLATITGHCHRELWGEIGDNTPVRESATVLLGVRELDPAERERLEASAIAVVGWRRGEPQADVEDALDKLSARVDEVYLHIDLDALDPRVAPGIVDPPVPGGMSIEQVEHATRATAARFRIAAAALTTYNPDLDDDGRTLRAALRIVELVAESRPWCT
jgi:arginase